MKEVIVLLAWPLLIAGCSVLDSSPASKFGDADPEIPMIRTKQQTFSYGRNATDISIAVTFTNKTEELVFINPCGKDMPGFALERKGKKWKTAYQSVCMAMAVPPIEVAPESTFIGIQLIFLTMGSRAEEGGPILEYAFKRVPGTYRLVWDIRDAATGELLPREHRTSNEFEITG